MGGQKSKIRVFGDFELSKEQQRELKMAFKAKADASGHVHKDLWVEGAVSRGIIAEFAELLFNAFDRRGDSYMDIEGYLGMLAVATSGTQNQKLSASFDLFDQNKDGFISEDEAQQVLRGCLLYERSKQGDESEITDSDVEEMKILSRLIFSEIGPAKEGKISREDFITNVPENPDLLKILQKF
eukprot:TRINITY_DN8644_c0_g1_i1.p1 TRINITY_DN8644_c0_g1~~TRINITY_DN8644_c0_g1_i1.p1  ORF type:complete len:184 (+),score=47.21 TRINITY_DN8644_c0_g1_i1:77-628(+)